MNACQKTTPAKPVKMPITSLSSPKHCKQMLCRYKDEMKKGWIRRQLECSCMKYFGKVLICLSSLKNAVLHWLIDGLTLPRTADEITLITQSLWRILSHDVHTQVSWNLGNSFEKGSSSEDVLNIKPNSGTMLNVKCQISLEDCWVSGRDPFGLN